MTTRLVLAASLLVSSALVACADVDASDAPIDSVPSALVATSPSVRFDENRLVAPVWAESKILVDHCRGTWSCTGTGQVTLHYDGARCLIEDVSTDWQTRTLLAREGTPEAKGIWKVEGPTLSLFLDGTPSTRCELVDRAD